MEEQNLSFGMHLFWQKTQQILEQVIQTQQESICGAAALCAQCIEQDGVVHVYGTGHARAFAMEMAGRAGGLVPVNRIDLEDLALHAGWDLARVKSPTIEREVEAGQAILSCYQIEKADICIIASNSGINAAIVEVAQNFKQSGHKLIAVTSLEHSQRMSSRHPSGQKLYQLADIVIDNGSPYGDALLSLPDGRKACAISSISGALIAQSICAETIALLLAHKQPVPILISANTPEGIAHNERIVQKYAGRIQAV